MKQENKGRYVRKLIAGILAATIFAVLSVIGAITLTYTSDYAMDSFISTICDYNSDISIKENPDIFAVKQDVKDSTSNYIFNDLLDIFYYNLDVSAVRCSIDNSFVIQELEESKIHIETQDTFWTEYRTTGTGETIIYLDYGLYSPYYIDSDLINRNYSNCDTFIYISDTIANKLIEKYDIKVAEDNYRDAYKELVMNDKYGIIHLLSDDISIQARIVNVLDSSSRNGPRTFELYGDFGLIHLNSHTHKEELQARFEIDLKNNPSTIRSVFNTTLALGYNESNSNFSYAIYQDGYHEDESVIVSFEEVISKDYNDTTIIAIFCFIILVAIAIPLITFFALKKKKTRYAISIFLGAMTCFFIGGIVISFTYWYPMFTLIPLILVIECLILALGDFIDVYRKHAKTEKN